MEYYLILNGVITLYMSVVAGYAFARVIKYKPQNEVAWRVVHSGGSMAGIMLLAFAGIWKYLSLGIYESLIGWLLIISTQILVIGMFMAAITGKRGLHASSAGIEKIIFLLYALGGLLSTVALTAILLAVVIQ
jgi:hypothetical protein